jgi:hypothetical protein
MKTILIASTALLLITTSASFAGVPALDELLLSKPGNGFVQLVKDGGDDGAGDDRGGDDHGRGGDDDGDDDANDDNGGGKNADDDGGRRPRVPGGAGCDDPGDVAEHASCRVQ